MANPTSKDTLIEYCKRRLGEPVIEINVDPDQLDDRIDEALQYYKEFHSDGTYRTYVSYEITQDDVDRGYIEVDDTIHQVVRAFAFYSSTNGTRNMFDIKYQMHLNDIANMHSYIGDLAYYEQLQQYLSMLDMKLSGTPQINFVYNQNRVYIFGDLNDDLNVGDYMVAEIYSVVDPDTYTKMWNDMWLKEYSTALIKQQWGANLIKFEGMQLPGGVMLNGRQIFDDATQEIERLREKIRMDHELPPDFFVG